MKLLHLNIFLASFSYLKPLCDGAAVATEMARRVMAAAAVTAPWHYHPDRIATYVSLMFANYWLLILELHNNCYKMRVVVVVSCLMCTYVTSVHLRV